MNAPTRSFRGWLTPRGRLQNRWAAALSCGDPAEALSRLRLVRDAFGAEPPRFADLWPPFLASLLVEPLQRALTDDDFTALEQISAAIASRAGSDLPLDAAWMPLAEARERRGDIRSARALYTRLFRATRQADVRGRCARALARSGAKGDEHLAVYVDYLTIVARPADEPSIVALLDEVGTVDFDADAVRIKRAGELARQMNDARVERPWVTAALALAVLLIDGDPAGAAGLFRSILQRDAASRVGFIGLLTSLIRSGAYADAAKVRRPATLRADPLVLGLLAAGEVLGWLDSGSDQPRPAGSLTQLQQPDVVRLLGESVDMAVGRLLLLDGDARGAANILLPLAKRVADPRWRYYAAFAALLSGRLDEVERMFSVSREWDRRWILAALLLDANPKAAEALGATVELERVQGQFAAIAHARLSLARSGGGSEVSWKPGRGTVEEDLEALRTMLGVAAARRPRPGIDGLVASPLFGRLPRAEQMLWRGVAVLDRGGTEGEAMLAEAAGRLEYGRAAMVLAVHLLHTNHPSDVPALLARLASRTDSKIELVRAYADLLRGKEDAAVARFEDLSRQGIARAYYALGGIYLRRAADARRAERPDLIATYRAQAVGALNTAVASGASLPATASAFAACAALAVKGPGALESAGTAWTAARAWSASLRRPWLMWHLSVARLAAGDPATAADAADQALEILHHSPAPSRAGVDTVAEALAFTCTRTTDAKRAETLAQRLAQIDSSDGSAVTRRSASIGLAAATHVRSVELGKLSARKAREHAVRAARIPHVGGLARLVAALWMVRDGMVEPAHAMLTEASGDTGEMDERLCGVMADVLGGRAPRSATLGEVPPVTAPPFAAALGVLQALATFQHGSLSDGCDALLRAMRHGDVSHLVDFSRVVPVMSAQCVRSSGGAPRILRESIRTLVADTGKRQPLLMARCAAAVGESETASALWDLAVADQPADGPLRREYAAYLAYLAASAQGAAAVALLEKAVASLNGEPVAKTKTKTKMPRSRATDVAEHAAANPSPAPALPSESKPFNPLRLLDTDLVAAPAWPMPSLAPQDVAETQLQPTGSSSTEIDQAMDYARSKHFPAAFGILDRLEGALGEHPDVVGARAEVLFREADWLAEKGRFTEAADSARRSLALNPALSQARRLLVEIGGNDEVERT